MKAFLKKKTLEKNRKKNIIFLLSFIIFLFILISNVDAYKKLCLRDGESVPLPPKEPRYTCHLSSGAGFCQICVTDLYNPTDLNRCAGIGECEYLSGQQNPEELTLNVGVNNNDVFETKSLGLGITTNKNAKIEYKDNTIIPEKWITLCTNCDNHNRKRSFKEGLNDITVRATRNTQIVEEQITFYVDSKKPRITKLLPSNNAYINNGEFLVYYDEDYLKQITLYINNNLILTRTDCPSGKKQVCMFNIDLTGYDGQKIEFYFEVQDIAQSVKSRPNKKITVDLTKPILTVYSPLDISDLNYQDYTTKKILIDVTMENKYDLKYIINNGNVRTLCSNCNKYSKYKTFNEGSYNLILYAIDKAGNIDQKTINFNVI